MAYRSLISEHHDFKIPNHGPIPSACGFCVAKVGKVDIMRRHYIPLAILENGHHRGQGQIGDGPIAKNFH